MIELLQDPHAWIALGTLTIMEIVLGIDNIVFISVIVGRLPPEQAARARRVGIFLALAFRVLALLALAWLIGLTRPVFELFGQPFSWRDIILLVGGLFLLYKGTVEIHAEYEGEDEQEAGSAGHAVSFTRVVMQIIVIDLVFSVDSIVTAIGMVDHVEIMIAAVSIAMVVMYLASGPIAEFIRRYPTTKMLALSFLLLIGASLVADGIGYHIPRGYIYFAMAFSGAVEAINILVRQRRRSGR